ncbi:MAG: hypothetical protein IZT55_03345 [Anaerolineae bacterium]|nr:hypothetical protein [Anaerolineae bacterium]
MIKKPSEFKYSWLAKFFRQVPSSYQAVTLGLTEVKITRSAGAEKIFYLDISDILVIVRPQRPLDKCVENLMESLLDSVRKL